MSAIHDAPNRSIQNTYSTKGTMTPRLRAKCPCCSDSEQVEWFQWVAVGGQSARDARDCDNLRQVNHVAVLIGQPRPITPVAQAESSLQRRCWAVQNNSHVIYPICFIIFCAVVTLLSEIHGVDQLQFKRHKHRIVDLPWPRLAGEPKAPATRIGSSRTIFCALLVHRLLPPGACPVKSAPPFCGASSFAISAAS
jgi:hypothetical protein